MLRHGRLALDPERVRATWDGQEVGLTATEFGLLRTLLGLDPAGENLVENPALPEHIGHIELLDIPGRWGRTDAYGRGQRQLTTQRMA